MSSSLEWSTEAHRTSKVAASLRAMAEVRADRAYERMKVGPYLEADESDENGAQFLIVPSDWFNEEAKEFWKSLRFRYDKNGGFPSWCIWIDGDGRKAENGKKFTAAQWLKSARAHFFSLHRAAFEKVEKQIQLEEAGK